ncbi:MAG: T9SS type A sorting domain-containing protein [Rhodothermales bacterium]|nr:T9SS type A sorting domain-containing protein [Rhodothermales bacterium]
MRVLYYRLAAILLLFGLAESPAQAQSNAKVIPSPVATSQVFAPQTPVGNCNLGSATKDLDINNVRARLYNTGGLFWKGSGNVYTVPKEGEANAIFASGIWIGGIDPAGDLRFAGTAYGPFEFWPGPIDEDGTPPSDCSEYDHLFKVSAADLQTLEDTGEATEDIENWPYDLGAPVTDGDGDPANYDIEAGDRPTLIGDQMVWWVMNDAGNVKEWSFSEPLGLEIQVTAFAFDQPGPMQNATFYKYRLENKGLVDLNDVYLGIWSDPDLGNAADDFVGSDTTRGLGIVYNGTDVDQGFDGYGDQPPALAYDFVQGPLVPDMTAGPPWIDPDGTQYPGMKRLKMSKFVYYNSDSAAQGNPNGNSMEPYDYLRGIWRDGRPMTFGGTGYGGSEITSYMFPGNAADRAYWSEENTDGQGSRNTPADRRFIMSVGPFDFNTGDVQEIIYGIIWSRSSDRLSSYRQLLQDDIQVQGLYNNGFVPTPRPDAPIVHAEEHDGEVIISWENHPSSNNYLETYDELSDFLVDQNPVDGNETYSFEGYQVYQFSSPDDTEGELIATYDVVNLVRGIAEETIDPETSLLVSKIVAKGTDSGVQQFHMVEDLVNYTEYYFGVRAYVYNPNSNPKVVMSPVSRVTVIPSRINARNGGTRLTANTGDVIDSQRVLGVGSSTGIRARVVAPLSVSGDTYSVRMCATTYIDNSSTYPDTIRATTYDILNESSGDTLFNSSTFFESRGSFPPFNTDVLVKDGIVFEIESAPFDFNAFLVTANAAGPIDPPTGGAADFQGFPVPERPGSGQQVGDGIWFWATGDVGTGANYDSVFIPRSIRNGFRPVVPWDWEIRFTAECFNAWRAAADADTPFATPANGCYGYDRFGIFGDSRPQLVPFELWNTGVNTPDDPSDDYRVIPAVIDWEGDGFDIQFVDSSVSGADNDPESDWFYWYQPCDAGCNANDTSPGENGYNRWQDDLLAGTTATSHGGEIMARTVVVNWNGGSIAAASDKADYLANIIDQAMPEPGTIFRAETTKPLAAGDVFIIDTAPFLPIENDESIAREALSSIGIVPNPYRGASAYEVNRLTDVARFTNLPQRATIRLFTLSGTLVRTFVKNGPATTLEWDLTNEDGLSIASGIYLIHVDVPGVGQTVIKFGVITGRVQLDLI